MKPEGEGEAGAAAGISPWLLWQVADSAFPAGSLGHSGGLEAAWRAGEIRGAGGLESYCAVSLRQAARSQLPLVLAARREPERAEALDRHCDAWLCNHVANRASRLQGRAFWMAFMRTLGEGRDDRSWPCGHWAPVFGVAMARLGAHAAQCARLFLFLQARGNVSAALRLGIVGPFEAQRTQSRLAAIAEAEAARSEEATLDDLAQVSPLLDLWQAAHDELETRLFQS